MASGTFHEDLRRDDRTEGPSDRRFGLTIGAILAAIGAWKSFHGSNWGLVWGALAAALIGCAFLRPAALSRLNDLWLRLGLLLHRIVNPLIMVFLFFVVIAPIGLLMRSLGKDPLRLKFDKAAASYWIARSDARPLPEAMRQQF
ncbi:MAG TPA: SxtJ family membrane protein [Bradyrhizobium sp.]|nr:SxtJ family membrane protein [Bradyrhizobium sp.]